MVKLDAKAVNAVRKAGLNPDDVALVLTRLISVVPHIAFSYWSLFEEDDEARDKKKPWAHYTDDGYGAHCHLFLLGNIHIAADLLAFNGVRKADLNLLDHMAREAAGLLKASSEASISLSGFGMHAASLTLADMMSLPVERISSYFKFLRSISGETYENQRLSYGLILSGTQRQGTSAVLGFDNKRFKRLTDGFSTALLLDRNGGILDLVALAPSRERKNSALGRPWWLAALADTAHQRESLGVALTRGGDILVVHRRELLFSQRAGEWRVWRHKAILGTIAELWHPRGDSSPLPKVLRMLYRVALDLSFRRSGGLLIVVENRAKLSRLVDSPSDIMNSAQRAEADKALDRSLSGKRIQDIDRRIVADLASLDGALVIDRSGMLLAYGAMVTSKKKTGAQGSRTRAAMGASRLGLAIKVSSDGGIAVYRKGKEVLAL